MSHKNSLRALALGAIGVVYGDIGTSPLYTIHEVFAGSHPLQISETLILSILSLIFWSLVFVVSVKYVAFIMRAENNGEGGIMALMALAMRTTDDHKTKMKWILPLGIFGAALFYGDGVITPAISVLSAVEGIELIAPSLEHYVIPLTLVILFCLFWVQKKGTASIGSLFGPIMCVWFGTLAVLGVINILNEPSVLKALYPSYALDFLINHHKIAFLSLGGVVLALTGAEALYADMGHFGRKPIQVAWFWFVLPALTLNYFGQGALLIHNPKAVESPFYLMAPDWALVPMILLATMATIIASQAVISGAFSITKQAMLLGYSPRMNVQHTSEHSIGQIYLPFINWSLMFAIAILVINFKTSASLGAAYGIAVTGTMVITTLLAFIVVKDLWKWNWFVSLVVIAFFMLFDFAYFSANAIKIEEGGWIPLFMGLVIYTLMVTWKKGRALHLKRIAEDEMELEPFIQSIKMNPPFRPDTTAVYLSAHSNGVPHSLLHNIYHNQVLHKSVLLVTVQIQDVPHINELEGVSVEKLDFGFNRIIVKYGFKDNPNIPHALEISKRFGIDYEPMKTSYFLGRDSLVPKLHSGFGYLRELLYIWMFKNSSSATTYFQIPPNRVVELGTQRVL